MHSFFLMLQNTRLHKSPVLFDVVLALLPRLNANVAAWVTVTTINVYWSKQQWSVKECWKWYLQLWTLRLRSFKFPYLVVMRPLVRMHRVLAKRMNDLESRLIKFPTIGKRNGPVHASLLHQHPRQGKMVLNKRYRITKFLFMVECFMYPLNGMHSISLPLHVSRSLCITIFTVKTANMYVNNSLVISLKVIALTAVQMAFSFISPRWKRQGTRNWRLARTMDLDKSWHTFHLSK